MNTHFRYSYMEQTNLLDRICKEGMSFEDVVDNPIPVEDARARLDALREKSLKFLHDALC